MGCGGEVYWTISTRCSSLRKQGFSGVCVGVGVGARVVCPLHGSEIKFKFMDRTDYVTRGKCASWLQFSNSPFEAAKTIYWIYSLLHSRHSAKHFRHILESITSKYWVSVSIFLCFIDLLVNMWWDWVTNEDYLVSTGELKSQQLISYALLYTGGVTIHTPQHALPPSSPHTFLSQQHLQNLFPHGLPHRTTVTSRAHQWT